MRTKEEPAFTAEGLEAISLRFGVLGRILAQPIEPETIARLMTTWPACQSHTARGRSGTASRTMPRPVNIRRRYAGFSPAVIR